MEVIGHDGIGTDINRQHRRQRFYSIKDPLFAMVKILASKPITSAQEGSAYTAGDAVGNGLGALVPP